MDKKKSGITILGDANNVFQSVTTGRVFVDGKLEPNILSITSNKKLSYKLICKGIKGFPESKAKKRRIDLLTAQKKRELFTPIENK